MFGFYKPKVKGLPPHVEFLTGKVADLEKRLHRRVPIDEHAVDHLCDFISAVAKIHPLGRLSLAARDLVTIAEALRAKAGRSHDYAEAARIQDVFARYNDYRDKEVTYEHMFELAEWILEGAAQMGDGDYENTIRKS